MLSNAGWKLVVLLLALGAMILFWPEPALAQGCSMCKATLENATDAGTQAKAINAAVLTLLLPPVILMGLILRLAYKYRGAEAAEPTDAERREE